MFASFTCVTSPGSLVDKNIRGMQKSGAGDRATCYLSSLICSSSFSQHLIGYWLKHQRTAAASEDPHSPWNAHQYFLPWASRVHYCLMKECYFAVFSAGQRKIVENLILFLMKGWIRDFRLDRWLRVSWSFIKKRSLVELISQIHGCFGVNYRLFFCFLWFFCSS